MPHPYKILNLRGYFSCKTIEIISRRRRENFLDWGEGQLPPPSKIWNDAPAVEVNVRSEPSNSRWSMVQLTYDGRKTD